MRSLTALCLLPILQAADPPSTTLRNAHLSMTVLTPDAKRGYYRGTRFDWGGMLMDVNFNQYKNFCEWNKDRKPDDPAAGVGPCGEFRTPLGYGDAKVGGAFLKIGVGSLVKPDEKNYRFDHAYDIKHPGLWETAIDDDALTFKQGLLSESGYGYKYTKTIDLLDDTSGFTIKHELLNAGTKDIETEYILSSYYNINKDRIGTNYSLYFPFAAKAANRRDRFNDLVTVTDKVLNFSGTLDNGSLAAEIEGYDSKLSHNGFAIYHLSSKVTMTSRGDEPLSKYELIALPDALCPQQTIKLKIKPNESKSWSITYKFVVGRKPGFAW